MRTRICSLAFVGGVGAVHMSSTPLATLWLAALGVATAFAAILARRQSRRQTDSAQHTFRAAFLSTALWTCIAFSFGIFYGSIWAGYRLHDALDSSNEDKVTRVVLRVAELPRLEPESRVFTADVLSSVPTGVPSRIQVRWNAPGYSGPYGARTAAEFPEIMPGQVWRIALVLRVPHGGRNPHGFDYEGHMFAQGIRATGTVRGSPVLVADDPLATLSVAAQRARHLVREAMLPHIADLRWGGVLLALAIGDQASVDAGDWLTFNRSGLTHLVSISGSHVTLMAALAGIAVNKLWRRLRWKGASLAERMPAQVAAAWTALSIAWLYCLLAGWGVPARRTFVMLAIMALSLAFRLPLGPSHVLAAAAVAVVALDPWSLLASGFWLSFLAVSVLMASTGWWGHSNIARKAARSARWAEQLKAAARLQLLVTLALMPPLALLFSEVSLVSPLANAYAIPIIGALVTPMALLLAGLAFVPGMEPVAHLIAVAANWLLQLCMWPTEWLSGLPGSSFIVAAAPWWATVLAMLGIGLALLPRGFPYRSMGWAFMLPALVWVPPRPGLGDWDLYALDVGQGSAIVLRTAGHVLVYDTGVRYSPNTDAAQRTLLPFLRAAGMRRIDTLVVSHADLDHAGGVRSVLDAVPVEQAYASFDLPGWLARESRLLAGAAMPRLPMAIAPCIYGASWRTDGVTFEFMWPLGARSIGAYAGTRERNRNSCVLRIRGSHHSILLPGDIGVDEELALVERGLGRVDLVFAAHHGSRYSSGQPFIEALQAQHVIAQAGRWNRYGHPADTVRGRWQAQGSTFWDTAQHGAILAQSRNGVLTVGAERLLRPRYWTTAASAR